MTAPRSGWRQSGLREWPLGLVIAGVAAGLLVVATDRFRAGSVIVGCSVLLGALLRAVLPSRLAGLLVVRTRPFDVMTLLALGGAVTALAIVVPPPR